MNAQLIDFCCGICLTKLNPENGNYRVLVCGHKFHQECLEDWFQRKNICPFCKIEDPTNPLRDFLRDNEERDSNPNILEHLIFILRNRYSEIEKDYFEQALLRMKDPKIKSKIKVETKL